MASNSEASSSFQWHHRELQLLSSFVQEQEEWLDSVLTSLQWSRERLLAGGQAGSLLTQCPYNQSHFVPEASLSKHRLKCRYGLVVEDEEEEEEEETEREGEGGEGAVLPSRGSGTPCVKISPSILQAVKKYAGETESSTMKADVSMRQQRRDYIPQSDVIVESRDSQMTKEYFSTLENSVTTPPDVLAQDPLHVIRYIKSWRLVPQDFLHITPGGLNPVEVRSWLFKHLPDKHAYRSALGGEMQAVEMVMHSLTGCDATLTPDALMSQLRPLFDLQTRPFVLRLWKFLHIISIQKQHVILDSVVDELLPLPLSSLPFLNQGGEKEGEGGDLEAEGLAEKIQSIAAEERCPSSPLPTLPMESAFFLLSSEERRLVYNYVVEVGGPVPGSHADDPNLYRDDAAAIKAKLKQQARADSEREMEGVVGETGGGRGGKKSYLQLMKEERDYRRRRQKYRARNVHITRRTPAEVMRDIINARMQEIGGAAPGDKKEEGEEEEETERDGDGKSSLNRNNIPRDYRKTAHLSNMETNFYERGRSHHERSEGGYSRWEQERPTSESLREYTAPRHRERSRSRETLKSRRSQSRERRERRESERQHRGHSPDRDKHHHRSVSDRDRHEHKSESERDGHHDKSVSDRDRYCDKSRDRHRDRSRSRDREKSHEKKKEKKKHRHRSRSKEREKRLKGKERSSSRDRKE